MHRFPLPGEPRYRWGRGALSPAVRRWLRFARMPDRPGPARAVILAVVHVALAETPPGLGTVRIRARLGDFFRWAAGFDARKVAEVILDLAEAWPWGVGITPVRRAVDNPARALRFGPPPGGAAADAAAVAATALYAMLAEEMPAEAALAQAQDRPVRALLVSPEEAAPLARVLEVHHSIAPLQPRPGLAWLERTALREAFVADECAGGFRVRLRGKGPFLLRADGHREAWWTVAGEGLNLGSDEIAWRLLQIKQVGTPPRGSGRGAFSWFRRSFCPSCSRRSRLQLAATDRPAIRTRRSLPAW